MPETCENWLSLVNISFYYACQTCVIYPVLPYSMAFKAPDGLEFLTLHWLSRATSSCIPALINVKQYIDAYLST